MRERHINKNVKQQLAEPAWQLFPFRRRTYEARFRVGSDQSVLVAWKERSTSACPSEHRTKSAPCALEMTAWQASGNGVARFSAALRHGTFRIESRTRLDSSPIGLSNRDRVGPPSSFLSSIAHPFGRNFFLSPTFLCFKNSRWRPNISR